MDKHIVVLTYNRHPLLERCIDSIRKSNTIPNSIIIVDNGTDGQTLEWAKLQRDITYITGDNSLGVTARNLGFRKVSSGIIFQVDDDSVVAPDWGEKLEHYFKDPQVGAIGQQGSYFDGWLGWNHDVPEDTECDFVTGFLWAFRAGLGWEYPECMAPFWHEESYLNLKIKCDGYKIIRCKPLGTHASHRSAPVDWPLHDRNLNHVINTFKPKVAEKYKEFQVFAKLTAEEYYHGHGG